jgi:hypothetical protein
MKLINILCENAESFNVEARSTHSNHSAVKGPCEV